ncbi:MAG: NnrU family protein [Alphaproteobacteria bacterium]|nr:NnrU family protein [Rhodobiaceae bacterium]MBO6543173.1 NnrU family protein [Alphaproteobacteria bacterium]MBO6626900.1 NnrU family protein [Alphaproteobacteria bacterium]MDF1627667.1 NnrU family protein [Parvibaculaceae bacterium]
MEQLIAAAAVFFGIHIFVSGTKLRDGIVRVMGEKLYMGLFSLASIGAIVWLAMSYNEAVVSAANIIYWQAPLGLLHAGGIVILVASFFVVTGVTTPGPTGAGGDTALGDASDPASLVKGIHAITRHPFLWGAVIWSCFHLAANGDRASQIFFGTFLAVAFLGTFSIDAKRKRKLGDAWNAYASASSNVPFLALVTGRAKFRFADLGLWRVGLAIAVFAGLFFAHEWLFAVSPVPAA